MAEQATIRCSEVWGGNHAVTTRLDLPGFDGWVVSRPYHDDEAGGDVHLISSCGTGRITRVLLADVSGHGDAVAELGGRLRSHMQRYMNHIEPRRLAARLNRDMVKLSDGSGRFATALVMTFFAPDGGLSICNAGHPPPLLYREKSQTWSAVDQPDAKGRIADLPLGVLEDAGYLGRRLTMDPGDVLLSYTDCLPEATHPQQGMLMIEGLLEAVSRVGVDPTEAPPVFVDALMKSLADGEYEWADDLTVLAVRCNARSEGAGFMERVRGVWRSAKTLVGSGPIPWPEWSWLNLGGMLLPGVKRKPVGESCETPRQDAE